MCKSLALWSSLRLSASSQEQKGKKPGNNGWQGRSVWSPSLLLLPAIKITSRLQCAWNWSCNALATCNVQHAARFHTNKTRQLIMIITKSQQRKAAAAAIKLPKHYDIQQRVNWIKFCKEFFVIAAIADLTKRNAAREQARCVLPIRLAKRDLLPVWVSCLPGAP